MLHIRDLLQHTPLEFDRFTLHEDEAGRRYCQLYWKRIGERSADSLFTVRSYLPETALRNYPANLYPVPGWVAADCLSWSAGSREDVYRTGRTPPPDVVLEPDRRQDERRLPVAWGRDEPRMSWRHGF